MRGRRTARVQEPVERVKGLVYVIRNVVGLCKIGHTNDLKTRMGEHKRQYLGQQLDVVLTRDVKNRYKAETALHRLFKGKRVHREWFDLTDADIETIKAMEL